MKKFVESKSLSNLQIFNAIREYENELLSVKFKKIIGQLKGLVHKPV